MTVYLIKVSSIRCGGRSSTSLRISRMELGVLRGRLAAMATVAVVHRGHTRSPRTTAHHVAPSPLLPSFHSCLVFLQENLPRTVAPMLTRQVPTQDLGHRRPIPRGAWPCRCGGGGGGVAAGGRVSVGRPWGGRRRGIGVRVGIESRQRISGSGSGSEQHSRQDGDGDQHPVTRLAQHQG